MSATKQHEVSCLRVAHGGYAIHGSLVVERVEAKNLCGQMVVLLEVMELIGGNSSEQNCGMMVLWYMPSGKLTWQWKITLLKMHSLLNMGIFHCYVCLPEGS